MQLCANVLKMGVENVEKAAGITVSPALFVTEKKT